MKVLYKNSINYSKESLDETYKTLVKPIGIGACGVLVILWLICTIFSFEEPELIIFVWTFIFVGLIVYVFLFFLWYHKQLAKNEIKRYNVLYHSDRVKRDIEFNEDDVKIHNLSSGWAITLYYNQLIKVKETEHYYVLLIWPSRLFMFLIIDKSWFTQWDPKTFKEFITSKIKSNQELKKPEQSKKAK